MKLVVAIVQDQDANRAVDELTNRGYGNTRINTAGGFLKRGNATILIGVQDAEVHDVMQALRDVCERRYESPETAVSAGVVFVLPVAASFKM